MERKQHQTPAERKARRLRAVHETGHSIGEIIIGMVSIAIMERIWPAVEHGEAIGRALWM